MTSVRQHLRHVVPPSLRSRLSATPAWSVGVYVGPSPLDLQPHPGATPLRLQPGDTDPSNLLMTADPFALPRDGRWYLFMEVVERHQRRGRIGLATSTDLVNWSYAGVVLQEPVHLSYPYVFEHDGDVWMVPESSALGQVRLYRATDFPMRWSLERVLLRGIAGKDSSLIRHAGSWWMLSETSRHHTNDELRLFTSLDLLGPWSEHRASPLVLRDPGAGRPAGRLVVHDEKVLRFAQDCRTGYGRAVRAFEVGLHPTTYSERLVRDPVLAGTQHGWNASAMHHLDAHRVGAEWVVFADGHP